MKEVILVVGLGLIGGSLATCIKKEHQNKEIIGWDFKPESLNIAKQQGIIDRIPESFEAAAIQADVIILAGPIQTTIGYMKQLQQLSLKEKVLVTDVGSTKVEVCMLGEQLPYDFIGGHPMAGSHKSGVLATNTLLFENAYFIFTPTTKSIQRMPELIELYKGTKAKFTELSPFEHDQVTGMLSHLPHIIAAGLVNQADQFSKEHQQAKQLAAGGFRDITRIASSDPIMWTDILLSNRETLIRLIEQWQDTMNNMKEKLEKRDKKSIHDFFKSAKEIRDAMPIHQNGAIPGFFDLLIDIPDDQGVIAKVTMLIDNANISLVNVKILETREDIMGVLQVTFKNEKDLLQAKAYIESKTSYHCRIK